MLVIHRYAQLFMFAASDQWSASSPSAVLLDFSCCRVNQQNDGAKLPVIETFKQLSRLGENIQQSSRWQIARNSSISPCPPILINGLRKKNSGLTFFFHFDSPFSQAHVKLRLHTQLPTLGLFMQSPPHAVAATSQYVDVIKYIDIRIRLIRIRWERDMLRGRLHKLWHASSLSKF